jgi:hypothetical protein
MPLRLGCDLDGVLADMESELIRHAKALFGETPSSSLSEPVVQQARLSTPTAATPRRNVSGLGALRLTDRQQRRLWRQVESVDGFWESLEEIEPGAVARLAALATELRWELIFLTKRPESAGATAQVQSQRWLQAHGFRLPSVYVVQGSRGRVADAFKLDFVIDDRPENCLDVVTESTTRALLVWREDETLVPAGAKRPGVQVVASMAECLDMLEQLREPGRERPSLIRWLKRQLGYDETEGVSK